jgi:hypothetical protein
MSKARDIASAAPAPSTVSATELGYLDGVTSAIQTQLDAKTAKSTLTTTGDIYYASAANTPARLGIGSTSDVLTVVAGVPSWAAPAGGGKVLQVVQDLQTGIVSTNGTTFVTTNCSQSITPSATSSKVLVLLTLSNVATTSGQVSVAVTLRRGGTDIANLGDAIGYTPVTTSYAYGGTISIAYLDSPSTTSSTTYEAFFKSGLSGTTVYIGNYNAANTVTSSIVVMEIGA